jgi:hypothetical protein
VEDMESGSSEGEGLWPASIYGAAGAKGSGASGRAERAGAQIVALNGRRVVRPR